ncbi:MAG: hypothetical protein JXL80_11180 [Planctomycetes bacterium]|nr:hypothetical protein [Planctomycetota bacterium]
MGRTKGPYKCEYPKGTRVRIADRDSLERFRREWQYHHKLTSKQLKYAGRKAVVARASFYHGGDELYELKGILGIWRIPGIWHEQCLNPIEGQEEKSDRWPDAVL